MDAMTPGRIAAEAHDRSLFGDETPFPWDKAASPAVIAWEAAATAVLEQCAMALMQQVAAVRSVIARYQDEELNAMTAWGEIEEIFAGD